MRNADQYQPEAVAVATELLESREVSEQDLEEVAEYSRESNVGDEHQPISISELKRAALNFFGPIGPSIAFKKFTCRSLALKCRVFAISATN